MTEDGDWEQGRFGGWNLEDKLVRLDECVCKSWLSVR